jgi:hypothetical protein
MKALFEGAGPLAVQSEAEIQLRNARRAEAKLPLLSVSDEIARQATVRAEADFARFVTRSSLLYERIWMRQVGRIRRRGGNPGYVPGSFLTRMGLNHYVQRVLRRIYASRRRMEERG